jgi:cellobiose-specific phosphotransferase system component IIA
MPEDRKAKAETQHEKARDKGEEALQALAEGKPEEADRKIAEAKRLDPSALEEIVEDLDEDAGSDPEVARKLPG